MCSRDRHAEWFSAVGRRASDLPMGVGCGLHIALMPNAPERERSLEQPGPVRCVVLCVLDILLRTGIALIAFIGIGIF